MPLLRQVSVHIREPERARAHHPLWREEVQVPRLQQELRPAVQHEDPHEEAPAAGGKELERGKLPLVRKLNRLQRFMLLIKYYTKM